MYSLGRAFHMPVEEEVVVEVVVAAVVAVGALVGVDRIEGRH